ncbi:MAG: amidase [Terriglobia bacterium]
MSELNFLSVSEMAALIRRREITAAELVAAHLAQIERFNPRLNALVWVDREGALRAADAADRALASGAEPGPLHGIPITIKSSIDVAGWRCESGTRLRAGRVAPNDAPLVARLRKSGAILMGNTNTPELLMAYETDNALYGRTQNPWDLGHTPGGSSGGEAAAIAAGLSAAGVGSDGGGSVRVPAHYSGICGLKPTPGRIPATGHYPPSAGPFALIGVVGPMARTVRDLEIMLEVMAGQDDGDPSSVSAPVRRLTGEDVRALRIGWFDEDDSAPATPETRAAVRHAAEILRQDGFTVSPFKPLQPDSLDDLGDLKNIPGLSGLAKARTLWWNIFGRAGGMILRPMIAGHERDLSPIFKEFLEIVAEYPPLTADELIETWVARDSLRARLLHEMRQFPVFICPVCSIPAFGHGEREWTVDGKRVTYLDAMSYTQWFNILGNPAVSVPLGTSPEGLPIGVQVVGRPYEEETVLAIAAAIERGGGWRRPTLARANS